MLEYIITFNFPTSCEHDRAVTHHLNDENKNEILNVGKQVPFPRVQPTGADTPAVLLRVRLLQHVIEREGGEEPFRGSRLQGVELQFRLLVNSLTHHGQGSHANDPLDLPGKGRLLRGKRTSLLLHASQS